jgi:hypothetical protein
MSPLGERLPSSDAPTCSTKKTATTPRARLAAGILATPTCTLGNHRGCRMASLFRSTIRGGKRRSHGSRVRPSGVA